MTNNTIEFLGRYRDIELHPGVVFLLPAVRRPDQVRLFEGALDHVRTNPDVVNRALDVTFDPNRSVIVTAYDLIPLPLSDQTGGAKLQQNCLGRVEPQYLAAATEIKSGWL